MREYLVKGALLYFSNGTRKRSEFQAKTTDIEKLREVIKNKHNAQVVRLEYEEAN
jgi:hypothetical protein